MTPIVKVVFGLSGVTGTVGLGVGGFYLSSKEDIFSKVKDEVLGTSKEFNASWKSQFKKLSFENENIPEDLKKLKSIKEENKQIEAIKGWCASAYQTTYKSVFSEEQVDILKIVRKYCIQTLQEKLTDFVAGNSSSKVLSTSESTDQQEFINNYKKLNGHNSSQDGKLDSVLSSFNAEQASSEASTKWSELRDWWKGALTKAFKGENDDLFKVTKKFCIKHTQ